MLMSLLQVQGSVTAPTRIPYKYINQRQVSEHCPIKSNPIYSECCKSPRSQVRFFFLLTILQLEVLRTGFSCMRATCSTTVLQTHTLAGIVGCSRHQSFPIHSSKLKKQQSFTTLFKIPSFCVEGASNHHISHFPPARKTVLPSQG